MAGPHCRRGGPHHCGMGHIYRFVEPVLLFRLLARGCSYGYELMGDLEVHALIGGSVDSAVLYRTLRHLETAGMVTSHWERPEAGPARRRYRLTEAGRERLSDWTAALGSLSDAIQRLLAGVESAREPTCT